MSSLIRDPSLYAEFLEPPFDLAKPEVSLDPELVESNAGLFFADAKLLAWLFACRTYSESREAGTFVRFRLNPECVLLEEGFYRSESDSSQDQVRSDIWFRARMNALDQDESIPKSITVSSELRSRVVLSGFPSPNEPKPSNGVHHQVYTPDSFGIPSKSYCVVIHVDELGVKRTIVFPKSILSSPINPSRDGIGGIELLVNSIPMDEKYTGGNKYVYYAGSANVVNELVVTESKLPKPNSDFDVEKYVVFEQLDGSTFIVFAHPTRNLEFQPPADIQVTNKIPVGTNSVGIVFAHVLAVRRGHYTRDSQNRSRNPLSQNINGIATYLFSDPKHLDFFQESSYPELSRCDLVWLAGFAQPVIITSNLLVGVEHYRSACLGVRLRLCSRTGKMFAEPIASHLSKKDACAIEYGKLMFPTFAKELDPSDMA